MNIDYKIAFDTKIITILLDSKVIVYLIISSILKIVIAAYVANLIELIFDIIGYKTPAFKLFLGFPFTRSNPQYFNSDFLGSTYPSF